MTNRPAAFALILAVSLILWGAICLGVILGLTFAGRI